MRVAELVRSKHKLADEFISAMKKSFVKCPRRKKKFSSETGIALPPEPVVTRWCTWLNASFYYSKHFEKINLHFDRYLNLDKFTKEFAAS